MKRAGSDLPQVAVGDPAAWRAWLAENHGRSGSVWLVRPRKGRPGHAPVADYVAEALAFGWVDSLPRKLDADRTMLLMSPRRPGSSWSAVNRGIVARLEAEGRMHPAGAAAVAAARADGSWERLEGVDALTEPPDLAAALDRVPQARSYWDRFPPSSRRGILEWIQSAKRAETRAARIAQTVTKAALNLKANHPEGRDRGPAA